MVRVRPLREHAPVAWSAEFGNRAHTGDKTVGSGVQMNRSDTIRQ